MSPFDHSPRPVRPAVKLLAFAAVLAVAFGAAAVVGDALGPAPSDAPTGHGPGAHGEHRAEAEAHPVRGLAVAEQGLRLVVATPEMRRGAAQEVAFRVVDDSGATRREFDVAHEKRMHLIVARRDLTGFQHLHPVQQADGSWTAPIRLPDAGSYRLFADFTADGDPVTLASDLRVDGPAELVPLPTPAKAARTDGYDVALDDHGSELAFTITREGRPVRVEPLLGAGGHLVALREGDLAFLHVHPTDEDGARFEATFPTAGRYRLFLQFKHGGRVHTASFTKAVS